MINWLKGHPRSWSQTKKLASLHWEFSPTVLRVLARLEAQGFKPKVHYGWRSKKVQADIVKRGRSRVRFSFHNCCYPKGEPCSLAADIIDRRYGWTKGTKAQRKAFWQALGAAAKAEGCKWGGKWRRPDWAHIQSGPNKDLKWAAETYPGPVGAEKG